MPRTNSAMLNGEILDAIEIDDNRQSKYKNAEFSCLECGVKIQFNRGIHKRDPHFKNWPNISHKENCEIVKINDQKRNSSNSSYESLISTILPRAERFANELSIKQKTIFHRRYFGERSKKFLNVLNTLTFREKRNTYLRTEDRQTVRLADLILRQDKIIEKLQDGGRQFICILYGHTDKAISLRNKSVRIPLTRSKSGNYSNTKEFSLFIPASYHEKNQEKISSMESKLIMCYGLAEINDYGAKMDLYSIEHQIVIVKLLPQGQ